MTEDSPAEESSISSGVNIPLEFQLDSSDKEQDLWKAVSIGQLEVVERILESARPPVDINCKDGTGRTPLALATEKKQVSELMVKLLIENGAETETAIVHTVTQENTDGLEILLRCRDRFENGWKSRNINCISRALVLATKLGNYELVKLLMMYGERVKEPDQHCSCNTCRPVEPTNISRSINSLKSYTTLSSPVYISAQYLVSNPRPEVVGTLAGPGYISAAVSPTANSDSSEDDPIYKAFELSKKLRKLSTINYEFKDKYLSLCEGLDNFSVDLLDECQDSEEIKLLINTEYGALDYNVQSIPEEARNLSILHFAITNGNKKVTIL